ncbi:hypothetical protein PIB30_024863 [Stylosanthes scabra]|uniref:Uncharacterized protein n=1 Tax=Stylosanthes scabra TaxID=79078 RepID=A0ABU6Q9E2_9FABA|nr:hypothetical protein [Stylosanthes scabra]
MEFSYPSKSKESVTVLVDRPPPEQPDLHSVAVGEGEPGSSLVTAEQKRNGCVGNGARAALRSAEVGAFAKKKWIAASMEDRAMPVEDAATKMRGISDVGYDGTRSSAEVGASVREKWSLTTAASRTSFVSAKGGATWRNGLAWFCRISPIVTKPPPLLAAVFPWDREGACSEKA